MSALDDIRQRSEGLTEGPWDYGTGYSADGERQVTTKADKAEFLALSLNDADGPLWLVDNTEVIPAVTGDGPKAKANAEFIAHARTDIPRLLGALDAVLALHKPVEVFEYDDMNGVFKLDADGEQILMATFCAGCTPDDALESIGDCEYDAGVFNGEVSWPCPTVAAVNDALETES